MLCMLYIWSNFTWILCKCMGCPRPSAPLPFAQLRQIKLNQIAALSPNCRGTCALIFCIFNTDLQSSPFSIPPLFDRQAGAKLWIHIYIWIFLKYSNPSFISSIRIHHKIRTKALSCLFHCACCRARGQLEPILSFELPKFNLESCQKLSFMLVYLRCFKNYKAHQNNWKGC